MHRDDKPNYTDYMRVRGYVLVEGRWMYAGNDDAIVPDISDRIRMEAEADDDRTD